jgi:hypothetical protein
MSLDYIELDYIIPQVDLFSEYSLGMRIQALVDYLWTHHNIEAHAEAYNKIYIESERDRAAAILIISGFSDIKIV